MRSSAPLVGVRDDRVVGVATSVTDESAELAESPDSAESARPIRPPGKPLSPRVIALSGLAIGIVFLTASTLDRRLSTDVFWQLAAGQWMLSHHSLIGLDPFSYTEPHTRWVADEWGSELALATLYKLIGASAYNVIAIVTGSMSLICTMAYARALGARGGRLATIAILVAVGIAGFVTQDRGLSFSLIWLPLELLILTKARTNPRWLCWLPVLCVLWVNTHGSILLGLFVVGVELVWSLAPPGVAAAVGGVGRSSYPRWLAVAGLASVMASCISPYGPKLLTYDLGVATNGQIGKYIQEWQSPDFHNVFMLLCFLVPLSVFAAAVRRHRIAVLEATLCAVCFVGALHSARVLIYLFIAAAGLSATLPARAAWSSRARRVMGALSVAFMVAAVALPSVPAGTVTTDTPVAAFNFLAPHPGRIFTQYTWGDYSIARHRATFVDGRTDLFVGKVLTQFFAVSNVTTNPDPILAGDDVDYVVWARGTPLEEFLAHDPQWVLVDRTAPAVVFARRTVWLHRSTS